MFANRVSCKKDFLGTGFQAEMEDQAAFLFVSGSLPINDFFFGAFGTRGGGAV